MLRPYGPLLVLLLVSVLNAVLLVAVSTLLSPTVRTPVKLSPYESGIVPLGTTRERQSVHFYLVAILFIVFDVETVLLVPWAVAARAVGGVGLGAALVFLLILAVGLVYEWKKGALEWS